MYCVGSFSSHLMGTFYRTIRLVENGIKPVYVFDGKPPELKSGELSKRAERREEAQKALEKAEEAGMYISSVHPPEEMYNCTRFVVKFTKNAAVLWRH